MLEAEERQRVQALHDAAVSLGATCTHRDHRRGDRIARASPDDPVHPGWPAGAPDSRGGKFAPKNPGILSLDEIPADSPKRPVPFADSRRQPILDDNGKTILRPFDLPPELFVQRGLDFGSTVATADELGPDVVGPELHDAAAGISLQDSLANQNDYAWLFSNFAPGEKKDDTYTSLPERNVRNTEIGYALFRSDRVSGATP